MGKVKKEIVEAAALKLLTNITSTMPSTTYKFLLGSMSALAALNKGKAIDQLLNFASDSEGFIDIDAMKAIINGGFEASGGKLSIDLFKNSGGIMSLLVKPITLTITKSDIDGLMREIEQNSIEDVRLSNENNNNTPVQASLQQADGSSSMA